MDAEAAPCRCNLVKDLFQDFQDVLVFGPPPVQPMGLETTGRDAHRSDGRRACPWNEHVLVDAES